MSTVNMIAEAIKYLDENPTTAVNLLVDPGVQVHGVRLELDRKNWFVLATNPKQPNVVRLIHVESITMIEYVAVELVNEDVVSPVETPEYDYLDEVMAKLAWAKTAAENMRAMFKGLP